VYIQKLIKADIPVKAIKTDSVVQIHFITLKLDGGMRSVSHLGPFDFG